MSDQSFRSEMAELDWSEDGLPYSIRFQDIYYSRSDAPGESAHVFLQASRLPERWSHAPADSDTFVIAELGFGAGLNFLQSWQQWQDKSGRHRGWRSLHYLAFEQHPLTLCDMKRLHQLWPDLSACSTLLLGQYRADCSGWHRIHLADDLCLDLIVGDAGTELARRSTQDICVDAWFLDGFSPQRNPQLWNRELFQLMANHSRAGSTVTTYSSAGAVRRNLEAVGFDVTRSPGFSNKRHMISGKMCSADDRDKAAVKSNRQPWFQYAQKKPQSRDAVVVGAGLAGCHAAYSLALRGWRVRVLDSRKRIDSGARGIPQLALRPRLFKQANAEARFYLLAFSYASRFYNRLQQNMDCGWHECGLLQLQQAINKRSALDADTVASLYPDSIVTPRLAPEETPAAKEFDGFWFNEGGWIDPALLCSRLLDSPRIQLCLDRKITTLRQDQDHWLLQDQQGQVCETAQAVVLACGGNVTVFDQASALEFEQTAGQCTVVKPSSAAEVALSNLGSVLSAERTLFPANHGKHTIAASYRSLDSGLEAIAGDDLENLHAAARLLKCELGDLQRIESPVATRANTRDRVPAIGPLPDFEGMQSRYGELSRNAQAVFEQAGTYHQGLYISAGHGSNGLASCPLAGEYLASLMSGTCLPLDQEVMNAINPCRFLIQDLKKQRMKSD